MRWHSVRCFVVAALAAIFGACEFSWDDTANSGSRILAKPWSPCPSKAGEQPIGGSAGVGVGADVQVLNKTTRAFLGGGVDATANGNNPVTTDRDCAGHPRSCFYADRHAGPLHLRILL